MTDKQITGLTQAEVDPRIQNGQVNQAIDDQSKTATQIIRENVFTYFNLIFAILAVLLVFVCLLYTSDAADEACGVD
ncbi:MAG: hypothetical protein N5847_07590, partial [Lactobacillus crispatus]|nr:hypothetical protein [Lactobacillus crispatus]